MTTNTKSTLDELSYFAEHSGAVGAVTQPKFVRLVAEAVSAVACACVTDTDNGAAPGDDLPGFELFDAMNAHPATLAARPRD
ncbi:MAG: hypothetical protein Q8S09_10825 [Hyphomonas sp.]|nr:hypothetical protein [Hyphomonas sp.]MDP3459756.1 hypothetical protein [Hyphomonas sp.]